jgi:NADH-quinone oxidoreductase subunit E
VGALIVSPLYSDMLSDTALARIKTEMANYPDSRSAIMPAIYIAQQEYGWLPQEAIDDIARVMGLSSTEVGSVASFYSMYYLKAVGRHVVDFCTDLPCALVGAQEVYDRLREKLGLRPGEETTADEAITLRPAMCLGGCNHAPVLLLDNERHLEQVTQTKLDQLVEQLHAKLHAEPT